jgi:hypothetical protein
MTRWARRRLLRTAAADGAIAGGGAALTAGSGGNTLLAAPRSTRTRGLNFFYRSPAYGPVAFGTSVRSPAATGWPAGGFVGIHGTDRPDLVPGRVSHGCIRLRNADIRALARRMRVGTPLTIH